MMLINGPQTSVTCHAYSLFIEANFDTKHKQKLLAAVSRLVISDTLTNFDFCTHWHHCRHIIVKLLLDCSLRHKQTGPQDLARRHPSCRGSDSGVSRS